MPTRTEAIKLFLLAKAPKDLAEAYNINMECQVNVAQDDGERVEDTYQGRQWHGWTNGLEMWKSFRIPYKANSTPEYEDKNMSFDLVNHAEGIGMTGWDWRTKVSKWVAYDFDGIIGHQERHTKKLSPIELEEVKNAAMAVDWVTVRKSTSGKGLHLYVYLEDISTANHTEHAALARSILGKLSAVTGFDFNTKVDACGGNMWVWHRKMIGTDGLIILKEGKVLKDIPPNWRDHIKVISGKRRRVDVVDLDNINEFEELAGQCNRIPLDTEHKKLIKYLQDKECFHWWDADHHMLVCHTKDLEDAYTDLNMQGIFKTNSIGSDRNEQNAFAFPMRKGAWNVRRYTRGIQEDMSWEQDGQGWTKCYLNRIPSLKTAALSSEGLEHENGSYLFKHASQAADAALKLKANIDLPNQVLGRKASLKQHKDGKRIIVTIDHDPQDNNMPGWLFDKNKWKRIFDVVYSDPIENEISNFDELSRHLITEGLEDAGWLIRSGEEWKQEPLAHIKVALESMGLKINEVKSILGSSVLKPWKLVNRPFQPEYIGDRQWNRNAPQYRFVPSLNKEDLKYPTWLSILNHIGESLNIAVSRNGWARANGILTGADYLKCWISSMLQEPLEPLPYLFLHGPQNSGKSIFHESLSLLMTKGVARADQALKNQQGFNGELENAVLCVIEETNLRQNKQAELRIKDWVNAIMLPIHKKRKTPFTIPNSTHWCQCDNEYDACPVFPGDTRITMFHVDALEPMALIPKKKLIPLLEKEAPDFLAACLNLEMPESPDRLNIPVIITDEKLRLEQENRSSLQIFIEDNYHYYPGKVIKLSILYDRFREWLEPNEISNWSKIKFGQYFSANVKTFPKGRSTKNGQWYIGNIHSTQPESRQDTDKIILEGDSLIRLDGNKINYD